MGLVDLLGPIVKNVAVVGSTTVEPLIMHRSFRKGVLSQVMLAVIGDCDHC